MQSELTVVIATAGLGRRMKSYGPKALIEVSGKQTILGRQLALVKARFPQADVVVVAGFEAERVAKVLPPGVRLVENEHYEETNAARSVVMALRASSCRRALVLHGDLVFNDRTLEGLPEDRSCVLVDTKGQIRETEVGCNVVGGLVTHFEFGLPARWCQIMHLAGRELALFRKLASGSARRRHFSFEVLNDLLEQDGALHAVEPHGMKIVEVDTSRDLEPARKLR